MNPSDDVTLPVEVNEQEAPYAYLELVVIVADGLEQRIPFTRSELAYGDWKARVQEGGQVTIEAPSLRYRGETCTSCRPGVGEKVLVGDAQIWLQDTRQPPSATLDGHNAHYELQPQQYLIGRKGTRHNNLELNDRTVSRSHAVLAPGAQDEWILLHESPTGVTTVNGVRLEAGHSQVLKNGDLLRFGELQFRFRQSGGARSGGSLRVKSLGRFEVGFGSETYVESGWKVEKAKWLFARLAVEWGRPLSVDLVLGMLWPELPSLRGRKNLSQCISWLEELFGTDTWLVRTPAVLQLNPEALGEHDYVLVKSLSKSLLGSEAFSTGSAERVLELYGGDFLPGCYDDWALLIRDEVRDQVRAVALRLAEHCFGARDWDRCQSAAQHAIRLDSCCQEAYLLGMRAAIEAGQPAEAARLFEQCKTRLRQELGVEPSTELMKYYYMVRL